MRTTLLFALLPAIVQLSSCAPEQAAMAQTGNTTAAPAGLHVDGVSSQEERRDLTAWIKDVEDLLVSTSFKNNLKTAAEAHTSIYVGSSKGSLNAVELDTLIRNAAAEYRYVPTPVALVGRIENVTALAGQSGEQTKVGNEAIWVTYMSIGRRHLTRYRSTNLVERSCAINTLAHERSHTYSSSPKYANLVIEDKGAGSPAIGGTKPLASYLIGTVAQCVDRRGKGTPVAG